jgi:hypothetical protein
MTWQLRLRDLIAAGGMLASCIQNPPPGANGIKDPCTDGRADYDPALKADCEMRDACRSQGGTWTGDVLDPTVDGGVPHCVFDAGVDNP